MLSRATVGLFVLLLGSSSHTAELGLDERVHQLVEAWSRAQTEMRFEAYAQLYGPGFHGTDVASKSTDAMDRARWLAHRHELFETKTTASVGTIEVRRRGDTLAVRFHCILQRDSRLEAIDDTLLLDDSLSIVGEDIGGFFPITLEDPNAAPLDEEAVEQTYAAALLHDALSDRPRVWRGNREGLAKMRALAKALSAHDEERVRPLLTDTHPLELELDGRDGRVVRFWSHIALTRDVFQFLKLSRQHGVTCEREHGKIVCDTAAQGWYARYTWTREDGALYLTSVQIDTH